MTTQQVAEAIYERVFEDFANSASSAEKIAQAEMLEKLFRFTNVKRIREVLEKCSQSS